MELRADELRIHGAAKAEAPQAYDHDTGSGWTVAGVLREAVALIAVTGEQALAYLVFGVAASAVSFGTASGDDVVALMENAFEELAWFLAVAVVQFWLLCGLVRVAIDAARTSRRASSALPRSRPTGFDLDDEHREGARAWDLFRVSFADYTEAGTVVAAQAGGLMLGLLCFLVPGLYFALGWSMALYAMLDHRARWFKSLAYSRALTRGSMGRLLLLGLVLVVAGVPGSLLSTQASLPDLREMPDFGLVVKASSPGIAAAAVGSSPPLAGLIGSVLSGISGLLWIYAGAVVYVNLEDGRSREKPAH
jgi:hypothetical protein